MTLQEILETTKPDEIRSIGETLAPLVGLSWGLGVEAILNAAIQNPSQAANVKASTAREILLKWVTNKNGLDARISRRRSKLPGTIPDPAIDVIIGTRFPHLSEENITRIRYGHRLAMSAENVLGLLLEEYLAIELAKFGWSCAWGETLRSIDFANVDGRLLQVKNRSNSENSSSSRVRANTAIAKWFRVDARTGGYLWEELNRTHPGLSLSEEKFREFITKTVAANPHALPAELDNIWSVRK